MSEWVTASQSGGFIVSLGAGKYRTLSTDMTRALLRDLAAALGETLVSDVLVVLDAADRADNDVPYNWADGEATALAQFTAAKSSMVSLSPGCVATLIRALTAKGE